MVSSETGRKYIGENMGYQQVSGRLSLLVAASVCLSLPMSSKG